MSTPHQLGRMFFNQTVEQLEADICASDGLFSALTSNLMLVCHIFLLLLILASFIASCCTFQLLADHTIFSDCATVILHSAMINGIIHQATLAIIRIQAIHHAVVYSKDKCSIQFHSSQCFYYNFVYYVTNIFSACSLLSLFLDRIFSFRLRSFYSSHQYAFAVVFIVLKAVGSFLLIFYTLPKSAYVGYVPMCYYPPQPVLVTFYYVSEIRIWGIVGMLCASVFILCLNSKRENTIIHHTFDTESRYQSYENLQTSKAVCLIMLVQILCLGPTSLGSMLLHRYELMMPESVFHLLMSFMAGTTYAHFFLPLIIYFSVVRILNSRAKALRLSTERTLNNFDDHFASLDQAWGSEKQRASEMVYDKNLFIIG